MLAGLWKQGKRPHISECLIDAHKDWQWTSTPSSVGSSPLKILDLHVGRRPEILCLEFTHHLLQTV